MQLKDYLQLTKPGIIFGNLVTATSGFMLASTKVFDGWLYFVMLVGLALVIGSACVWNNYLDRNMDQKMFRTKNRVLVRGALSVTCATRFGLVLGFMGITVLWLGTNMLTTLIAACGFFFYVVVYGISKYKTSLGTLIGSISGAIPPVVGYTAVSHSLDLAALLVFLIVVFWQMPHFFAIALYRIDDYSKASIPVLPLKKGVWATKVQMLLYTVAFACTSALLTVCGYTGYTYLAVVTTLSAWWLWLSIEGFDAENDRLWARKMFIFSLVVIMVLAAVISLDFLLENGAPQ